jgi:hypothetical protein
MEIKEKKVSIDRSIADPNADVYLTITIGNAQIGGNVVRWKGSPDILGKGEISNLNLGKGSDAKGKTLEIITNILDVNPSTNGVVATYYFHNVTDPTLTIDDTVNNHGDVCSIELDTDFK